MKATRCNCGSITVDLDDGTTESMTCLAFLRKFALWPIPPRTQKTCLTCSPKPATEPAAEPAPMPQAAEIAPRVA